jgi:hypothetical protein
MEIGLGEHVRRGEGEIQIPVDCGGNDEVDFEGTQTVSALHSFVSNNHKKDPRVNSTSYGSHSTNGSNQAATSLSTIEIESAPTNVDSSYTESLNGEDPSVVVVKDIKFWGTFVLFMLMGSGANWVFATALAQETPYYENHLSQGDCIATYMNAATNFSFIAVIIYLGFYRFYSVPHKYSVPSLLFLSGFGSFLCAATSLETINGTPVALLICCAIGGIVGGLAGVIMQPFMTYFKTDFISAARAGGSGCMVLTALVSIAQDPGTSTQHFSVAVYFVIFGVILTLSLVAYFFITHNKLGLKDAHVTPLEISSSAVKQTRSSDLSIDNIYAKDKKDFLSENMTRHQTGQITFAASRKVADTIMSSLMDSLIPEAWFEAYPWLRVTLPYLLTVAWIDFNTWGMLSAVGPFAMYNTSYNGGALNLAVALEMGSFALFFGDFSTVYFRLPFCYSLVFFTAFSFTVYVYAGFNDIQFSSSTAPVLIAVWTIGRYLEAHMLTTCYRAVAVEVQFQHRESAARAVGLFDQIFTTLGAVVSTALVSSLAKC